MRFLKFLILIVFFTLTSVYAISDIQITSENPKVGDVVIVKGKTNPNEEITCEAWFEMTPLIYENYYGYIMNDVEIPITPNSFKIIGENVNDLAVSVKMGIWITKRAKANGKGVAVVSKSNIPPGSYEIKIGGTIKDPSKPVKLKIIGSSIIKADGNGNFKYSYKIPNIPSGTKIYLNIGGIKKEVIVSENIPAPPTNDNVNNANVNNTTVDKEPPKIIILSPNKRKYNTDEVDFDIVVKDKSSYYVKIYLNGKEIRYKKEDNHIFGTLYLNPGENELKIKSKDKFNNKNEILLKLTYVPNEINHTNTTNTSTNNIINRINTNNKSNIDSNIIKNKSNTNNIINNKKTNENIIYGTIIKKIGNATLTIEDGTKTNKKGEINIKEVFIPNTTISYLIAPEDAEFSKSLELRIKITTNKNIRVLYYNSSLGSWIDIPYKIKKGEVIIKVNEGGYYAIKEINLDSNNSLINDIFSIFSIIKNIFKNIYNISLNILLNISVRFYQ